MIPLRQYFTAIMALVVVLIAAPTVHASDSAQAGAPVHVLAPDYAVSPQMHAQDIKNAAASGYTLIINNRPDGEGGKSQPASADLARSAAKAGIDYVHIPFSPGHLTPEVLEKMKAALSGHKGKTLAFCRSGGRATSAWAMAKAALGEIEPDDALKAAQTAGYDLHHQRARLAALFAEHDAAGH